LSRLRILLLFAAVAGLAIVFAACGSSSGGSGENPETVLKEATFRGIENADVQATVGIDIKGSEGGHVKVDLSGPFQSAGEGQLPELDMTAKSEGSVNGQDAGLEAGLVLLPSRAYVSYEGTEYEVDPTTFSYVESVLNRAQTEGGGSSPASVECQEAAAKSLDVAAFVEHPKNEGAADVGGTETTKISGDLNVGGAVDAAIKISEEPACSAQLKSAGPLPIAKLVQAKGEIEKVLKSGTVDVYVGEDHIVRRLTAKLEIEAEGKEKSAEVELDVSLNKVNEGQEISAPSNAEPLNKLFLKLGINPIELLQATSGGAGLGGLLEGLSGGKGGGGASGLQGLVPHG
jgi:hypothetical protein